jgi:hemerythrin superfamily protein
LGTITVDIYNYLKKDHRKVSSLFQDIIAAEDDVEREHLFLLVMQELELHADSEHDTFYQALSKSSKGEKDAQHGDEEHDEIKKAISALSKIPLT